MKDNPKVIGTFKIAKSTMEEMKDHCWVRRESFSGLMEKFVIEYLKNNPLSRAEKDLIKSTKKS
jgi:hypothetical protein